MPHDIDLAAEHNSVKAKRRNRLQHRLRTHYYEGGEPEVRAQDDDPADRAQRVVRQMLSGRGQ